MIKDEVYKFFADYIYEHSGSVYSPTDYYRLESRLKELVKIHSVNSVDEVYEMYKKNITPDMKTVLINLSTNNETYFFRDNVPFLLFSKTIVPELLKKEPMWPLNIWSAASSTGQEAYSLLMSVSNSLGEAALNRMSIFASDISGDVLKKAQEGIYTGLEVQRGLPITLLMKYFTKLENDTWQINKNVQAKVKFFNFNLLKDKFPNEQYHVVFCRNVLIYQNNVNKNNILNNIYASLKVGGYLFMGNGESLIGMNTKFEKVTIDNYTMYKKVAK